jgi:hypothetical protein
MTRYGYRAVLRGGLFAVWPIRNPPATPRQQQRRYHLKLAVVPPTSNVTSSDRRITFPTVRLFGVGLGVPRDQREAEFRSYRNKRRRLGRDGRLL